MKYRSRTDIAADILGIAQGGAKKTRIMYSAFVSFPRLKIYLKALIDGGLLEYVDLDNVYVTTEKGKHFLKMYREVDSMVPKESIVIKVAS